MKTTIGILTVLLAAVSGFALDPYPIAVDSQSETVEGVTVYKGSPRSFLLSMTDGSGVMPLTNTTPFMAWETSVDADSVVTASVSIVSATGGTAIASFSAPDLNYTPGTYVYEVGILDGSTPTTVRQGSFSIRASPYSTGASATTFASNLVIAAYNWIGRFGLANLVEGISTDVTGDVLAEWPNLDTNSTDDVTVTTTNLENYLLTATIAATYAPTTDLFLRSVYPYMDTDSRDDVAVTTTNLASYILAMAIRGMTNTVAGNSETYAVAQDALLSNGLVNAFTRDIGDSSNGLFLAWTRDDIAQSNGLVLAWGRDIGTSSNGMALAWARDDATSSNGMVNAWARDDTTSYNLATNAAIQGRLQETQTLAQVAELGNTLGVDLNMGAGGQSVSNVTYIYSASLGRVLDLESPALEFDGIDVLMFGPQGPDVASGKSLGFPSNHAVRIIGASTNTALTAPEYFLPTVPAVKTYVDDYVGDAVGGYVTISTLNAATNTVFGAATNAAISASATYTDDATNALATSAAAGATNAITSGGLVDISALLGGTGDGASPQRPALLWRASDLLPLVHDGLTGFRERTLDNGAYMVAGVGYFTVGAATQTDSVSVQWSVPSTWTSWSSNVTEFFAYPAAPGPAWDIIIYGVTVDGDYHPIDMAAVHSNFDMALSSSAVTSLQSYAVSVTNFASTNYSLFVTELRGDTDCSNAIYFANGKLIP